MMSRWLRFLYLRASPSGKTDIVGVYSGPTMLGEIRWYPRWRQYAFHPNEGTLYNPECLTDIAQHVEEMTRQHRAKRGGDDG